MIPGEPGLEIVGCPVCEHASSLVWLNDGKPTRYLRCLDCGTVYASPRASRAERDAWLKKTFSKEDENIQNLTEGRRPALAREAKLIQQHIPAGCMLDVGCSLGALFEFFAPQLWERHGVELSPSAAQYASDTNKVEVKVGTLRQANYPDASFDLVTLIDTLYYLDDPAAEINEIHRILKPGGWLAIEIAGQAYMLWRNYGLASWLLDNRWSRASTDSSYLYWFSPHSLCQLLAKCKFQPNAWHVIPSPRRGNLFLDSISNFHFFLLGALSQFSFGSLTWAPKFICLAFRPWDNQ